MNVESHTNLILISARASEREGRDRTRDEWVDIIHEIVPRARKILRANFALAVRK